jgi:hypothetical protein
VVRAIVVSTRDSVVDHVGAPRRLLEQASPLAAVEGYLIEVETFPS